MIQRIPTTRRHAPRPATVFVLAVVAMLLGYFAARFV